MPWTLDDTRPIYLQLEDIIKSKIIAGIYKPGQKLPSVRELAAEAAVNPNTMQKALSWNAAAWSTLSAPAADTSPRTPPLCKI